MSHESFRRAIIADPADDLPRLVYADWLDENGEAARAEFIRVQCELAKMAEDDSRRPVLEDREHELLGEHEPHWFGWWELTEHVIARWDWHRGFLRSVTAAFPPIDMGDSLFGLHPITQWHEAGTNSSVKEVVLGRVYADWVARVETLDLAEEGFRPAKLYNDLCQSDLARLTAIDISHNPGIGELSSVLSSWEIAQKLRAIAYGGRTGPNFRWADAENETLDAAAFVAAMADAPLEDLTAFDCGLTAAGLGKLLTAPFAPRLKSLDVSDNHISPDAWRAFRDAARGLRLERLDVSGTALANISLGPVLDSAAVEDLESLAINRCGSARVNLDVVARSRFWTQARELRAHGGTIPASTLEPLCQSAGSSSLRLLDLADNFLRTEGVRMLCDAPWAGGLTWLALSRNYLDDESLSVLADSGRFTKLRTLHLAHNNFDQDRSEDEIITDAGVQRLAATPSLARLRVLTLSFTGVSDRTVDVVLNAPHWRLSGLGLDGCDLSADAVRVLAGSPRLGRLQWLSLASNPRLHGDALLPLAESPYLSRLCKLDVGGCYVGQRTLEALRARLGPRLSC